MVVDLEAYIGFLGVVFQFAGAVLLATLFILLRRYSRRRTYFFLWAEGWAALVLATAALGVRYALDWPLERYPEESDALVRSLYVVYQFGKLVFFGFLAAGVAVYVRAVQPPVVLRRLLPVAAVYAIVSAVVSLDRDWLLVWQTPAAAAAFWWCAFKLGRLPPSRRVLGATATAASFAALASLWTVYAIMYGGWLAGSRILDGLLAFHAPLNMLLHLGLGFGMVVMVMEDAKREVDDAHTELSLAHNQLQRSSYYDAMTGSLNRRAFIEGVGFETARSRHGAVMVLDIDCFKEVNDELGHAAGDALLAYLVSVLRGTLRPSDKIYRWGGDEFLIVLPGAHADGARARLVATLAQTPPLEWPARGGGIRLTVSCGVAPYDSVEELQHAIDRADHAMYEEKKLRKAAAGAAPRGQRTTAALAERSRG